MKFDYYSIYGAEGGALLPVCSHARLLSDLLLFPDYDSMEPDMRIRYYWNIIHDIGVPGCEIKKMITGGYFFNPRVVAECGGEIVGTANYALNL